MPAGRRTPVTDLTAGTGLSTLSGQPVVDVARATLAAGSSMLSAWTELEPLVRTLTKQVAAHIASDDLKPEYSARLLGLVATVTQKVGSAATMVLRATEGQSKLALLLDAGRVRRAQPAEMTEKQLIGAVVETVKRLQQKGKACPVCHALPAVEVS